VGQLIDAMRSRYVERREWLQKKTGKIDFDFFFQCQDQRLENLHNSFYVYYVFDLNLFIAVALSLIVLVSGIIGIFANNTVVMRFASPVYYTILRDWPVY
jgi:hypothetical protein